MYPGSEHVRAAGPLGATDSDVWVFAAHEGFTIVSKDNDFRQLAFVRGAPPKVIWLSVGNAPTQQIASLLSDAAARVAAFEADVQASLLVLEA
jgi:predicted nuclease of predicted toxin-antitoxin system